MVDSGGVIDGHSFTGRKGAVFFWFHLAKHFSFKYLFAEKRLEPDPGRLGILTLRTIEGSETAWNSPFMVSKSMKIHF
jgi:hypothetical protein